MDIIFPIDLLLKMRSNDIKYGLFDSTMGDIITPTDPRFKKPNYLDNNCVIMKPDEVWKNNAGTCWDCALMEYVELSKLDMISNLSVFYHESRFGKNQSEMVTHTATTFKNKKNGLFYWFEYSWFRYMGINGPYENSKDMHNSIKKILKSSFTKLAFYNENVDVKKILKLDTITIDAFIDIVRGN